MLRQLQLANRAVVGISHQQIITVDRDSERMLQARVVEVPLIQPKSKSPAPTSVTICGSFDSIIARTAELSLSAM